MAHVANYIADPDLQVLVSGTPIIRKLERKREICGIVELHRSDLEF